MKYALIGCGRIAVNHIKAVANNNLDLVAVCDIDPSKFDTMFEKAGFGDFPGTERCSDYSAMLDAHPEIELVGIATESGEHAKIALDCIERGINVIIEKPMAMSMQDADLIVERAHEKGVKVSVCHQNRFNLAIQKLRGHSTGVVSGLSPMVRSMSAGIAANLITSRRPGEEHGSRMAARS